MNKYDAIIIGAGPAGSIAARTLAEAGVKVLLTEKDFKRVKPCGGGTPSTSFKDFNLPESEITKKIKTMSVISPSGKRIDVSIKDGYLAMVERGSFDNALRKEAVKKGAELMEAEFKRLEERDGKIFATVTNKGGERTITSDFLIASDGVNSRVATSMGLGSLPGVYTIQEEIQIKDAEKFDGLNACEFWFGLTHAPNFYSWVFPKKEYLDFGTGAIDGKTLGGLLNNFKMRYGVGHAARQIVYRIPIRQRKSLVHRHILFAGDAGGLVMPMSYEGIYYAMRSGKMAAEAIIAGKPKAYEKEWNKKFLRQFNFMRRLQGYFLKNEKRIEKLVDLHKRTGAQDASLRLWLHKDVKVSSLLSYLGFFKHILS
ncbi:MAG: geranylgeranyl reductase family protein [Nitrospirae bacterium]|nr:geranylgeranyl reductase family protein [Nitrospirota bacterium]